jgi:hypothetical protein
VGSGARRRPGRHDGASEFRVPRRPRRARVHRDTRHGARTPRTMTRMTPGPAATRTTALKLNSNLPRRPGGSLGLPKGKQLQVPTRTVDCHWQHNASGCH